MTHTWATPQRDGFHTITRVARIWPQEVDGFKSAYREANLALQEAIIQAILSDKVHIPCKIELHISFDVQREDRWLRLDAFLPGAEAPLEH